MAIMRKDKWVTVCHFYNTYTQNTTLPLSGLKKKDWEEMGKKAIKRRKHLENNMQAFVLTVLAMGEK
jgi:hypothetical protein